MIQTCTYILIAPKKKLSLYSHTHMLPLSGGGQRIFFHLGLALPFIFVLEFVMLVWNFVRLLFEFYSHSTIQRCKKMRGSSKLFDLSN